MVRIPDIMPLVLISTLLTGTAFAKQTDATPPTIDFFLLEPDRFNAALSGLVDVDFNQVRNDLLAMQNQLDKLTARQQSYYYFYLALSSRKIKLRADKVFPNLDLALSTRSALSPKQQFQILIKASELAMDYRLYGTALEYLDQLQSLLPKVDDHIFNYDLASLDFIRAKALRGKGDHVAAIQLLHATIAKAEQAGFTPELQWLFYLLNVLESENRYEEAIQVGEKLLYLHPSSQSRTKLRDIKRSQGRYNKAQQTKNRQQDSQS